MTKLEYTPENCEKLANQIAEDMDFDSIMSYVIEDLYFSMLENEDLFHENQEMMKEREENH